MKIDQQTGLLDEVLFIASPNCDERPVNTAVDLLVIHGISLPPGRFGGEEIIDLFCNRLDLEAHDFFKTLVSLRVSSHLLIRRDGQIIQFVPLTMRAWHAGVSSYEERESCNDFSIGIELEGTDDIAYTEMQYQQLARLTKEIFQVYPNITVERIVGHSDIAPTRKTDPGSAFSWNHFRNLLKE